MSDFPSDVLQLVRSPPFHSDGAFPYSSPTHPPPTPHPLVQFISLPKMTKRKQRFFVDRRYKQAVGFWHFHFSNSEDCKDCGDYVRYVFSFVPGILAAICVLTVLLLQVSQTVKNQNGECQVCLQAVGHVNVLLIISIMAKTVLTVC